MSDFFPRPSLGPENGSGGFFAGGELVKGTLFSLSSVSNEVSNVSGTLESFPEAFNGTKMNDDTMVDMTSLEVPSAAQDTVKLSKMMSTGNIGEARVVTGFFDASTSSGNRSDDSNKYDQQTEESDEQDFDEEEYIDDDDDDDDDDDSDEDYNKDEEKEYEPPSSSREIMSDTDEDEIWNSRRKRSRPPKTNSFRSIQSLHY